MTVLQALVLGIVQGLTEFLPVSSSGHLVLLQNLLNIDLEGIDMFFDIMLHMGTLVAVCVVYWKDIINLFRRPYKNLIYLICASIPAAIVGMLLSDWIDEVFYGGTYLFIGFLITALILALTQVYSKKQAAQLPLGGSIAKPLTVKNVICMGVAQAVAVLPGISRSGSTVAAGTLSGADRGETANFSFLMSIPVIAGSFLVSLVKGLYDGEIADTFANAGSNFGLCVAVSVAAAAISGYAAIKIMIKAIKKGNYTAFIIYLVLIAILCAVLTFTGAF